jgi:transglutaminase-like putative cysteine protease
VNATPVQAAEKVVAWLKANFVYEITPKDLAPATILARKRGDCTEYSELTVALLRASGIPAELREGMALHGDELVAHNWVAFHDGDAWREIEPTWGYTFVDAGHLETSVYRFIALVSLGELKITEVATE